MFFSTGNAGRVYELLLGSQRIDRHRRLLRPNDEAVVETLAERRLHRDQSRRELLPDGDGSPAGSLAGSGRPLLSLSV